VWIAAMTQTIPLIEIQAMAGTESAARHIADEALHAALKDIGFAYVAGHGIGDVEIERVREISKAFFALPDEIKQSYALNRWHRGYMIPKSSIIVTSSVAKVTKPNQSESFLAMHDLAPDDPDILAEVPLAGPNQWPVEVKEFETVCLGYMRDMRALSMRLVHSIARGFGLDENWFDDEFARPTEFLRLLHYWPQEPEEDLYGAAPHTDYGFLTLVAQDAVGGLEVRGRDGEWIPAPPIPGTFVLNVADILARWTGGVFVSTPHRVRNLSGEERYSQPYFFDPSMHTMVAPIEEIGGGEPFAPVKYADYLMERLDKNYAYRKKLAG
jgi:isopenicillin N synthase-like dioxygenase